MSPVVRPRVYTVVSSVFERLLDNELLTCILLQGGSARVTTAGLYWNLHNEELRFGSFISTSNHITRDVVEVTTSESVIFTLELA